MNSLEHLHPSPPMSSPSMTLNQIYNISYMDMIHDNDRVTPLISKDIRKKRQILFKIADQHEEWRKHVLTLKNNLYFNMPQTNPQPVPFNVWKNYVLTYRSEWWQEKFGCEFNPICGNDCFLKGRACHCGPFNGVVLDGERTLVE